MNRRIKMKERKKAIINSGLTPYAARCRAA